MARKTLLFASDLAGLLDAIFADCGSASTTSFERSKLEQSALLQDGSRRTVKMALVNARSLSNKTFILNDFFYKTRFGFSVYF